jgi:predicted nucleic acid-binding protein
MSDAVIDSSVVAKWVLPEADSPQAQRVLADVSASGGRLILLDLVLPEVTNAIWKRLHRGLITMPEARAFLDVLLRMPVEIQPAAPLLPSALEIAAQSDRTIYDSLFVALAHSVGVKGVTADEPLHSAVHTQFPEIILLSNW